MIKIFSQAPGEGAYHTLAATSFRAPWGEGGWRDFGAWRDHTCANAIQYLTCCQRTFALGACEEDQGHQDSSFELHFHPAHGIGVILSR